MPFPIETLIPHRDPMRWIDDLIDCTETTATAVATFGPGHLAVENGFVLETALVECVAQTVAAALGCRAANRKPSDILSSGGMLVAVSNFKIEQRPPAGSTLRIEIEERKKFGPMLLVSGRIFWNDRLVASGELTLYA